MARVLFAVLALCCLAVCLMTPVLHFLGSLTSEAYKDIFLAGSLGWFVFATSWVLSEKKI